MPQICPSCGAPWTSGDLACGQCKKPGSAIDAIHCPMCAEYVPRGAAQCRWCGEAIGAVKVIPGVNVPPAPPPPAPADGTAALVVAILGTLGLFVCGVPILLGPVAWAMAVGVDKRRAAAGLPPDGMSTAAKVIGIILSILLILALLAILAFVGLAVAVSAPGHH